MTDQAEQKARPSHLFKPGQSGNPNGRPKGSKNAITLVKLAMESELRAQMKGHMSDVVAAVIAQAKAGDFNSQKLLWDAWVSKSRASGDDDLPKERVVIQVGRLDNDRPIINGHVVKDSNESEG